MDSPNRVQPDLIRFFRLAPLALASLATPAWASGPEPLAVSCDGGRSFLVRLTQQGARVTVAGQTLMLVPRPSSLGRRFEGPGSALILDEDRVVLVLANDVGFENCRLDR